MENQITENEVLETKKPKEKNKKTGKIIKIVAILVAFVTLLVLAITVFTAPTKVTFSLGKSGPLGRPKIKPQVVNDDKKIEAPDEKLFEFEHYVFLGWFDNIEGKGEAIDFETKTFEESTTIYPIWDVIYYTITYVYGADKADFNYHFANSDEDPNPQTYCITHDYIAKSDELLFDDLKYQHDSDHKLLLSDLQKIGLTLEVPIRDGYNFGGWKIYTINDNGDEVESNTPIGEIKRAPLGNIIIKAVWN